MSRLDKIKRAASLLETSCLLFGAWALLFRATLYWKLPAGEGEAYGTGDLLDLSFALILFVLCSLCASCGVAISVMGDRPDKRQAYQAALIGMLSFIAYDLIHPHMPRLM